jgi:SsrA-binding protein
MNNKPEPSKKIIAQNRRARHEYFIEESLEVGIVLMGSEVKSVREGNVNIADSYADEQNGEVLLLQAYIAEYKGANQFNHIPKRPRKLLLHKNEIKKLFGKLKVKGYTLVPLSIYLNEKNIVKLEIGLAKGKKQYDKRASEKERDWNRDKARISRGE